MKIKIVPYIFIALFSQSFAYATVSATEQKIIDCDPVVHIDVQATTLQKVLTHLAKQHNFDLTFPVDADRPVDSVDSMTLSQSLKYLTTDLNIVLQHEKVEACTKPRLVAMEVLPVGEDTEYVYIKPTEEFGSATQISHSASSQEKQKEKQKPVPVDIDNMELYVEEVLLKTRVRDRGLTREQRIAFIEAQDRIRARLEAEGVLEPVRKITKEDIENRRKRRNQGRTRE